MLVFEKLFLHKNVPLENLYFNDKPVYVAEGFGGRPLENWPVVDFFRQYAAGNNDAARQDFIAWYLDQFQRQGHLPKNAGGMHQGTLYRIVKQQHEAVGRPFSVGEGIMSLSIVEKATAIRVDQRLNFIEGIMNSGFCPELSDHPVAGIRRGAKIVLQEGHHRAAAFIALGRKNIPEMLVFPEWGGWQLYKIMRYFVRIRRILARVQERLAQKL
jgi:hypothetical protein